MKKYINKVWMLLLTGTILASCNKFESINVNPLAASADQVQVEYFINNSIIGAQQDPHVAERAFVLYWKTAGRQHLASGLSVGAYNDSWSSDYYGTSYMAGWLNNINSAIDVGNSQIEAGNIKAYTQNLVQVSRIWRAYLMSELADNFGPIPLNGFQGVNPDFSNLKDVYYFLLAELKDAGSKLDLNVISPAELQKFDQVYGFNYSKWKKYANSMRLRLAMRLSEVDAQKAKAEFEDAVTGDLILAAADNFQVQERPGWDPLSGVMTREWNAQIMSATVNNLYLGLGGIKSEDQLTANFHSSIKPANYLGLKLDQHFSMMTNSPGAGYWLDGLPNTIDPRAYKAFIIPGDFTNPNFCSYPSWATNATVTTRNLVTAAGDVQKTINAAATWNAFPAGDWGAKGAKNQVRAFEGTMPRLSQRFRGNQSARIFFSNWETYFLIAEAAVRNWSTPISGQVAYEEGIKASFEYFGVESHLANYLTSTEFNRTGTSVSWNHITEPPATHTMDFEDGYTGTPGTVQVPYPVNHLYMNGAVKNDRLTKIMTQKFIAQTPWLPLETWSDHRRLGLPFFENPCVENPIPTLPALNSSNYMTSDKRFFPQRLKYPTSLPNTNATGYNQAIEALGGDDEVLTPLWWAKD